MTMNRLVQRGMLQPVLGESEIVLEVSIHEAWRFQSAQHPFKVGPIHNWQPWEPYCRESKKFPSQVDRHLKLVEQRLPV